MFECRTDTGQNALWRLSRSRFLDGSLQAVASLAVRRTWLFALQYPALCDKQMIKPLGTTSFDPSKSLLSLARYLSYNHSCDDKLMRERQREKAAAANVPCCNHQRGNGKATKYCTGDKLIALLVSKIARHGSCFLFALHRTKGSSQSKEAFQNRKKHSHRDSLRSADEKGRDPEKPRPRACAWP